MAAAASGTSVLVAGLLECYSSPALLFEATNPILANRGFFDTFCSSSSLEFLSFLAPDSSGLLTLAVEESRAKRTPCTLSLCMAQSSRPVRSVDVVVNPLSSDYVVCTFDASVNQSLDRARVTSLENQVVQQQQEIAALRAELQRAQAALHQQTRMFAVVSHEMRTPLSGILGSLSELSAMTDTRLPSDLSEAFRIAQVCGGHLELLIADLLDFAKLEENRVQIDCIAFASLCPLDEALDIVAVNAEKKQIELVCDVDDAFPLAAKGDPARVRQVLVALLTNAVKFSPSRAEVVVTASARDIDDQGTRELCFAVQDFGIGIADNQRAHLFQPFQQGSMHVARQFGGTGLGLYICKRLAEMMGGTIWFDSREGAGSTFYFAFRVQTPTPAEIGTPLLVRRSSSESSKESVDAATSVRRASACCRVRIVTQPRPIWAERLPEQERTWHVVHPRVIQCLC
eukprot:TRINITY_DN4088_c0_g1_i3.p1 TRINITY_DN4088_c0_g1~~TRINITY_DN4088_c0_g1_i3.p1  ORF type:complete len:457 (+),score=101.29 TRINITY_DN4088_c0_g1_i3:69-1439(+)